MLLKDTAVSVTGGGRDIGRACGMRLADEGARVAINYHASGDRGQSAAEEIKAAGGQASAPGGDLTKNADVTSLVDRIRAEFGDDIHGLVHITGGLVARRKIDEMDEDHRNKVMDLNTTSYFRMIKAVEPYMSEGSSIVGFAPRQAAMVAGREQWPMPHQRALPYHDTRVCKGVWAAHPGECNLSRPDRYVLPQHFHPT